MIRFDILKDGKRTALTLSYDDGKLSDRRLVEIMNKHGIRGTFHLNSGRIGTDENFVSKQELTTLYKNHEISCHGVYHYALSTLAPQNIIGEILDDRRDLEAITGTIVRGMSYANGVYSDEMIGAVKNCGIVYSRTVQSTHSFTFPEDFMKWHPTCHHRDCLEDAKAFFHQLERGFRPYPRLFYVWGHSYEFDAFNNWEIIEEFCELMGGRDDIWYATNIELYEYITAQKSLIISADNKTVHNPTATKVWFSESGEVYSINPGETLKL